MDFSPLKLPTDNLYKFLALGGLASFLFSITVPFFVVRDLQVEAVGLERESARMMERGKDQEEDADKLQQEVSQQKASWEKKLAEAVTLSEPDRQKLKADIAEWKKAVDAKSAILTTTLETQRDAISKIDALNKQIEVRTADVDRMLSYWPLAFWGGIIMTLVGFAAWFWRVQRHQDALLRAQVREFETNAPRAKGKLKPDNARGK